MKEFLKHLKEKGYTIEKDKAILLGTEFKICSGYKTTAMRKQKCYWLELL